MIELCFAAFHLGYSKYFQILDDVQTPTSQIGSSMKEICRSMILAIEANPQNLGTPDDPILMMQDFEMLMCPGDCSGHGQCQNGTCICDAGIMFDVFFRQERYLSTCFHSFYVESRRITVLNVCILQCCAEEAVPRVKKSEGENFCGVGVQCNRGSHQMHTHAKEMMACEKK